MGDESRVEIRACRQLQGVIPFFGEPLVRDYYGGQFILSKVGHVLVQFSRVKGAYISLSPGESCLLYFTG